MCFENSHHEETSQARKCLAFSTRVVAKTVEACEYPLIAGSRVLFRCVTAQGWLFKVVPDAFSIRVCTNIWMPLNVLGFGTPQLYIWRTIVGGSSGLIFGELNCQKNHLTDCKVAHVEMTTLGNWTL